MIDWLTFVIALVIIASLVGFFGFLAWKINESNSLTLDKSDGHPHHHSLTESTTEKKKGHEQNKKKRKEQKKPERDVKHEETKQRNSSKEPSTQTSEEVEDESEQDSSSAQAATNDLSSKARRRNKNKSSAAASTAARVPPVAQPKLAANKEEVATGKQPATKAQGKPAPTGTTTTKKTSAPAAPQEQGTDEDQPFTVVGGNRNKNSSGAQPPKTQVVNTQTPPAVSQAEPLAPRQSALPKETTTTTTTGPFSAVTAVAPATKSSPVPMKLADLVKGLPSSKVVVTELMSALDASTLSSDELELIMHKIANKQSVLKQDWSKLQYGKKVDSEGHVGQVMDESSKNYQEDLKSNSNKRIGELTEELQSEKRRVSDLLKDKTDRDREIQILHAQLDSIQPKQLSSQQQTLQAQLQRLTEENLQLRQQRQQVDTAGATGEAGQVPQRVMQEQMCKLSVQNADLEKKVRRVEAVLEETQKQKEQLAQSLEKLQRDWKQNEEKHHQLQNSHQTEIREFQVRLAQLEKDNEQLRREEIVHVEPSTTTDVQTITLTNEEREQLENEIEKLKGEQQTWHEQQRQHQQTMTELEESKKKVHELQNQVQTVENVWKQEKQTWNESRDHELGQKNGQLDALRAELGEWKTKHETAVHQAGEHRRHLVDLLPEDLRHQISSDNQDSEQWLSSYRNVFHSHLDSTKRQWEEQSAALKKENDQLHQNMQEIGKQLKDIEQTVQSKEELLIHELKNKDEKMGTLLNENEHLTGELQRLRTELERVQSTYETSLSEIRALKVQLDERFLVAANTPPVVADESFELIKQSPSSLSPIVIDVRAEQLNELIRSSKEALENQDSLTEQLDRHLDDMNRGTGAGETSSSNVDESHAASSNQQ